MSRVDSESRSCRACGAELPSENAFCGVCGARATLTEHSAGDHLIGQVVDRKFRLEACIATGGMGSVYRAEHVGIGKQVAIKFLRADLRGHPLLVQRLRREAMAVSKLTDVHTISVFDFGVWQGLAYLVMEYLQGEDLAAVLNREKVFTPQRTLFVAKSVCASLAEAHGVGVIHRDLKPENVFLTRSASGDENVKVLDFGLAKILGDNEGVEGRFQTQDGALLGTPYYMAPEQVDGEPVDARTDLYALGTLMYRMLTGVLPFTGKTPRDVFSAQRSRTLPSFHDAAPEREIPSSIETLVRDLLARERAERPESAVAVGARVRALLVESGEQPEPADNAAQPMPRLDTWQDEVIDDESAQDWVIGSEGSDSPRTAPVEGELVFRDDEADFQPRIESGHPTSGDPALHGRETADLLYARSLRRGRVGKLLFALLLVSVLGGVGWWQVQTNELRVPAFEEEPNDTASEANPLRLGREVRGYIGRRTERSRTDQDVYLIPMSPGVDAVEISLGGVPEVDLVIEVYTDRAVRLAKENRSGKGEGEKFTLKDIKADRLQIVVRGLWIPGVAPVENSTDAYTLLVTPVQSTGTVPDEGGTKLAEPTPYSDDQGQTSQGKK